MDLGVAGVGSLLHGEISGEVLRLFYHVHDRLGFGYLESVYCNALAHEFVNAGVAFERQAPIKVWYDGTCIGLFRADFLVAGCLIAEVKACESLNAAHRKQLMNYLRGSTVELGRLLHFGRKPAFNRILYTNDRKPEFRTCIPIP